MEELKEAGAQARFEDELESFESEWMNSEDEKTLSGILRLELMTRLKKSDWTQRLLKVSSLQSFLHLIHDKIMAMKGDGLTNLWVETLTTLHTIQIDKGDEDASFKYKRLISDDRLLTLFKACREQGSLIEMLIETRCELSEWSDYDFLAQKCLEREQWHLLDALLHDSQWSAKWLKELSRKDWSQLPLDSQPLLLITISGNDAGFKQLYKHKQALVEDCFDKLQCLPFLVNMVDRDSPFRLKLLSMLDFDLLKASVLAEDCALSAILLAILRNTAESQVLDLDLSVMCDDLIQKFSRKCTEQGLIQDALQDLIRHCLE